MKIYKINYLTAYVLFFLLINCSNSEINNKNHSINNTKAKKNYVKILSPLRNNNNITSRNFLLKIISVDSIPFDSVKCIIEDQSFDIKSVNSNSLTREIIFKPEKTGVKSVKIISYLHDSIKELDYSEIVVVSDIIPEKYTYKIIKTLKHHKDAYTQGLVYENGKIYEGTGAWGESRLMKYLPDELKPENEIYIDPSLFGEGIEVFDNNIIQLTYKAHKGFIYNKETFEKIREFNFPYNEGWGITYDGKNFIMSDGTNNLYILDKKYLTETGRIEVYDNEGAIDNINELEYVNDKIYANIYRQNKIVVIDPLSGKILENIDMSGLLSPSDYHDRIDVLNGIAYNPSTSSFYVTGKYWPKMFEVKFIKK